MSISKEKHEIIEKVLLESIRKKLKKYKPETKHMPFHTRLLGKDRMALFSFIQSLNTSFGTSIYEPVAIALAEFRFKKVVCQVKPYNFISTEAQAKIQKIIDDLTTSTASPDKEREIEEIRNVCQKGEMNKVKLTKVDIFLESKNSDFYLIDLKTVKPNIGEFKSFKRTLLEWAAALLAQNPKASINTLIGIPYNPYEPEPYARWTMKGMFDLKKEIFVAEELWEFLGGNDTYKDLLNCFEIVGILLRTEIDEYFKKFK